MTLTVENADANVLSILRGLQGLKKNLLILQDETVATEETREALRELADMEAHPENYKTYSTWAEAKEAMLNEV